MRKNILFITADQFRHDALGLLKAFPVQTPNLDRLAETGCLFENAYCASPLCGPSRAAIMTGQYPFENGVYYNDQGWFRSTPTTPGILSQNGYYAAKIGKTHFQPKHYHGGFDKVIGNFDLTHRFEKANAESDKTGWARVLETQYKKRRAPTQMESYEPVVHTDEALKELRKIVDRRECIGESATEPFFMWVSYQQPHTPCNPPEPFGSMYDPDQMRDAIKSADEVEHFAPLLKRFMKYWEDIDEETRRGFMARYLGSVSLIDKMVGDLVKFLEDNRLTENTMIVFSADHGDYLGDHHMQQKAFFHDCASKVPLIIHGPGVAAGRRVKENVSLVDLLSTFLDCADLLRTDRRDEEGRPIYDRGFETSGVSLLPLMAPDAPPPPEASDRVVVCESGIHGQAIMLKQGHIKVNYYPQSGDWDYFDTAADPDELRNLGGKERPSLTPEMARALDHVLEGSARWKDGKYYFEKLRPMFS